MRGRESERSTKATTARCRRCGLSCIVEGPHAGRRNWSRNEGLWGIQSKSWSNFESQERREL